MLDIDETDCCYKSSMIPVHVTCVRTVSEPLRMKVLEICFERKADSPSCCFFVLVGEVNLALVTAPPQDAQITAVPFAPAPLYALLPENHPAAQKERLVLQDLAKDEWILFPKRFDPVVFEAIMDAAQCGSIVPKHAHDVIAPQQAVDLVSERLGVAILAQPSATSFHADGVVVKRFPIRRCASKHASS